MDNIKPKIVKVFDSIDFVKQVCYENNTQDDELTLIVIYEHDDAKYSDNIIFRQFFKLENILPDIYMEIRILHTSEVGPYRLSNAVTIFKRK